MFYFITFLENRFFQFFCDLQQNCTSLNLQTFQIKYLDYGKRPLINFKPMKSSISAFGMIYNQLTLNFAEKKSNSMLLNFYK